MSVRSRRTMLDLVAKPLIDAGHDPEQVEAKTIEVMKGVVGKGDKKNPLKTGQITVLGHPEIRFVRETVKAMLADPEAKLKDLLNREERKNLKALGTAAGLDAALFGRMTTGDLIARGDAAIHVAHAFTVHEEDTEDDYFSAIDDLTRNMEDADEQAGSGHIGTNELTSGLYYVYVVVDVPLLISNLTGVDRSNVDQADRAMSAEVVKRLIGLITTVSPGAKLGSTAPYAHAHTLIVEAGNSQPRTLANAFETPVNGTSRLEDAYAAVQSYVAEMDAMYPSYKADRVAAGIRTPAGFIATLGADDAVRSVDSIAQWAADRVLA
jgi:CRISPR system Cascade subunit CasC